MKPASTNKVTIGIGGLLGHDANAALFVDGQLIASSQEERYSRIKHDGRFPAHAIADCLQIAGLNNAHVTDIVFAEKPLQTHFHNLSGHPGNFLTRTLGLLSPPGLPGLYDKPAQLLFPTARFHYAWHHLTHVAGAFHSSPFDRAAFLCIDGKGEDCSCSAGIIDNNSLEILWEQPYENGLGLLYSLITCHLGFYSFGSEYKVMGLAPYGKPTLCNQLSQLYTTDSRGALRLNRPVRFQWSIMESFFPWVAEITGIPIRSPSDPLTADHVNLASSLQHIFETEIFKMARFVRSETNENNLLFCGGCAQNCVTAGKLREAKVFDHLFNSPVGGDMGSGLGAALLHERERAIHPLSINPRGFYLGSEPGPPPGDAAPWHIDSDPSLFDFIAHQLASGKIVAWVRDRMELGARALGARSILADPRQPGMQSRLNLAVKFRESFRPFAPLILAEDCADWFDTIEPSDFMQYTAYLLPPRRNLQPDHFPSLRDQLDYPRCDIASVVHVDYSARIQTVNRDIHPDMHRLLTAFKHHTGIPILINTSFNVAGQPIVRTADEAWDCFINTDIDLLVINDSVFKNPFQKSREEKLSWLNQFAKSA